MKITERILGEHFTIPAESCQMARRFESITGFEYEPMWITDDPNNKLPRSPTMYRGE